MAYSAFRRFCEALLLPLDRGFAADKGLIGLQIKPVFVRRLSFCDFCVFSFCMGVNGASGASLHIESTDSMIQE